MGKKQHQSDKLYVTYNEHTNLFGGKKREVFGSEFKRLPFDCCALTFLPFANPMCNASGAVFDLMAIVPFVKKHGIDPTTGEKLELKDLIKLNFAKNTEGKYHCPVTFKEFNENSHIVAIRQTGNVYAYEAVEELNIKSKNWKDLLTDEPFTRKDIITIQDPSDLAKFNLVNFYHMKNHLSAETDEQSASKLDPSYFLKAKNSEVSLALKELYSADAKWKKDIALKSEMDSKTTADPLDDEHTAIDSTGEVSRSFTSSHITVRTKNTHATLDRDLVRYKKVRSKGYVRIKTTLGDLNIELHCDLVPRVCDNFVRHCLAGYYNGTKFHWLVKNFIIQGGDPTGTGTGGKSAFPGGEAFEDEFHFSLSHNERGVLSMANHGPNTNLAQFFFTLRACPHLDKKHVVFGRIVGGLDVLGKMEAIPTNSKEEPIHEVQVLETLVFVNPFADADKKPDDVPKTPTLPADLPEKPKPLREGVGKYLKAPDYSSSSAGSEQPKKKLKSSSDLSDFDAW